MIVDFLIIIKLAFLAIAFLIFINWESFFIEIKKVDKKYFFCLIVLFVLTALLFNGGLSFFPSYHEWGALSAAKHLNPQTFYQEKEGVLFPAILAFFFKIIGAIPETAVLLNFFLGALCVFLIFLLVKIIFGSDLAAFLSAVIFLLNPLTIWYFFVKSGWPAVTCFWLLFILFVFLIFLKNQNNFSLAILTAILIVLAAQIRAEFSILVLLVPIGFILCFKSLKNYCSGASFAKILLFSLVFVAVFLFFLSPDIIKNNLR
ncbi:MAG: hypothetical protein PHW15_03115, partial [Patescibacteria group bacterium]|nr:hypothetical protein [Patescibacteria group bacterium]